MYFHTAKPAYFRREYDRARYDSELIRNATSEFDPAASRGTRYFIGTTLDDKGAIVTAGFAIRADGELVYLFCTGRGHGDAIVMAAILRGATHLDCFEGHLTRLYERHGFIDYKSEPNWTPGGPRVVYMQLRSL